MIPLVILKQNIIFRHILLYKRRLKHKSFKFGGADNIFEIINVIHHFLNLGQMVGAGAEILADSVFKFFRLADIDYFFILVFHNINAGGKRQSHSFSAQFFFGQNNSSFLIIIPQNVSQK